ncbi:glycosyltransferase family 90 protein [Thermothielavioides terrestris NRRL 8126]|uniref:Glycosyltransferase family 90 protein n=1 Tax=Thermothielavioides terrestris (strain ATCC 38088 / NRRL 8126) TaxID=578455 RepID=G2R6L6_THETT|nr:glycosyltransferase family 90 protein [Thermothielavioides terrestris NRRL 8126]AEO68497.1 glycosyltransferase family 90 protein [Thermothielavioides terrestris NRRL 8126]
MGFPPRPTRCLRYILTALLLTLTLHFLTASDTIASWVWPLTGANKHPIDALIQAAEREFAAKLSKSTQTLAAAAAAYRKRRGRHPPPWFDKWYKFATEHGAIIVEDFWDQIYHDLEPFWGVQPAQIRKDARDFEMRIQIRDGKASTESDWWWTQIWLNMIQTIEHLLPDMDVALNPMDEPRMVVPWEDIEVYMKRAAKTRRTADVRSVVSDFSPLPPVGEASQEHHGDAQPIEWEHDEHYWPIARRGCPPDSPARLAEVITDFDKPPSIASPFSLAHMRNGYVANYTLSTDFCQQPDLQALEGIFVEPLSTSATKSLIPLFGGSKLFRNNDILLPSPIYWSEEDRFIGAEGASIPWASKHSSALWRGVATGGRNRETNWRAFQRHRFVAMNNASLLAQRADPPPNFALPDKRYALPAAAQADLPGWIARTTDVAFTEMVCLYEGFTPTCNYTAPYFAPVENVPMADMFQHKYLPDIDGNSFSGRYLGFLRSTSVPVKATLFREWHDARLVAWKHFVPMDPRFGDWWGILGYFLGRDREGTADKVGERIALAGREWAGRVLRKEDMAVYVLRLLLEYGRVMDDRREVMGWVEDLRQEL